MTAYLGYALEKELGTPLGRLVVVAIGAIMLCNYNRDMIRHLELIDKSCEVVDLLIEKCNPSYRTIKFHVIIFSSFWR